MIKIVKGDITTLAVDAIVNAANQVMLGNAPKKLVSEGNFERSETFPCISTGVYGYPIEDAAKIAVREVMLYLTRIPQPKAVREADALAGVRRRAAKGAEMEVVFCCFSDFDRNVYTQLAR